MRSYSVRRRIAVRCVPAIRCVFWRKVLPAFWKIGCRRRWSPATRTFTWPLSAANVICAGI
ncbi:hypothetical protein KCP70_21555 [Salmonella enterica subsp. enterica]|nr:hypothetical protein KCP70_21555 [Salmonella enterica subsp. enterica]